MVIFIILLRSNMKRTQRALGILIKVRPIQSAGNPQPERLFTLLLFRHFSDKLKSVKHSSSIF